MGDRMYDKDGRYYVQEADDDEDEEEEEEEDEEDEYEEDTPDEMDRRDIVVNGARNPYETTTFPTADASTMRQASSIKNFATKLVKSSFSRDSLPRAANDGGRVEEGSGAYGKMYPASDLQTKSFTLGRLSGVGTIKETVDTWFANLNSELLVSKAFYFFFFSAFGALYPLLGVYLKQLAFNPKQTGLVMGFRPFVELCSAPLWGTIADRYQRAKHILLFSLMCWIVFTLAVAFVVPKPAGCVVFNDTHRFFEPPLNDRSLGVEGYENVRIELTTVPSSEKIILEGVNQTLVRPHETIVIERLRKDRNKRDISLKDFFDIKRKGHRLPKDYVIGKSPVRIPNDWIHNYPAGGKVLVKPTFTNVIYDEAEVQRVFLINLMLMIIGEFFAAPATPLADSVTLGSLGTKSNNYGKQRMFGSLGWGISMFFIGIALDQSTSFPNHPCGDHDPGEKNYTICFAVFSVLMSLAFITATQFYFKYQTEEDFMIQMKDYRDTDEEIEVRKADDSPDFKNDPILHKQTYLENENYAGNNDGTVKTHPPTKKKKMKVSKTEDRIWRQNELRSDLPSWIKALKNMSNPYQITFLFISFIMGNGMGLVFTFLFWHLQDIGGSPTVFGVASIINHLSELFMYFFSVLIIRQLGHIKIIYLALAGNAIRFLYISWITNPWWVLPFEFIQGLTHAAVWIACSSFISTTIAPELKKPSQSLLQAIHHGLGRGCGAVIGGILVNSYGTKLVFRIYGIVSALLLIIFFGMNRYFKDTDHYRQRIDSRYLEEQIHLDPHGLPLNPISRETSKNLLDIGNPKIPDLTSYNINRLTPIYKGTHIQEKNLMDD